MSSLDELQQKVEAFRNNENYVNMRGADWDSLPDSVPRIVMQYQQGERVNYIRSETRERVVEAGGRFSVLDDSGYATHYEIVKDGDGYTAQVVTDNDGGGRLLFDGKAFMLADGGEQDEFYLKRGEAPGQFEIVNWRDFESKVHYDPNTTRSFAAAFKVDRGDGQVDTYFMAHGAEEGRYVALTQDEVVYVIDDVIGPLLRDSEIEQGLKDGLKRWGGMPAMLTQDPLTVEEFGRLSEIGIEVPDVEVAVEPVAVDLGAKSGGVIEAQPKAEMPDVDVLANVVGAEVIEPVIEAEERVEVRPVLEMLRESTGLILPEEGDLQFKQIKPENILYEAASNVFFSLQADGVINQDVLQRFDEVVALFDAREGEGAKYGNILQEMRDVMYDEAGQWRDNPQPDWARVSEIQAEMDQHFASRIDAIVNPPAADVETAPSSSAAPIIEPNR